MVFLVRRGPIISDMPLQNMISSMLPLHMHICKRWSSFLIPCSSDWGLVVDMGSDQSPPLVHRSSNHWCRHRSRSPYCLHLHEVSSKLVSMTQFFSLWSISFQRDLHPKAAWNPGHPDASRGQHRLIFVHLFLHNSNRTLL